ncbi:MAG: hypothetical protein HYR56_12625 [Acidobacteria bacterium]|nr:hypothetical protein [Acidobacteriota bacterium]MBI3425499.1 hypothetical protein [Acidobacteriota bacterium]
MTLCCWRLLRHAIWLAFWLGMPVGAARAHPAWGICVSADGEVYFADAAQQRIWKINRRGTLVSLLKGQHSHNLWLDQAGDVFGEHATWDAAANQWRNRRWLFDTDDKLIELGSSSLSAMHGTGFARDAAGNQYEVESSAQTMRLLKRTAAGQLIFLAGGAPGYADGYGAQAQFTAIGALVLGADGALYLCDQACIRRVAPDGNVTTVGGNPLAGVARSAQPLILGLAVDAQGNVLVADTEQHAVRRINAEQRVETIFTTGRFWLPAGVTVFNNEVFVLESLADVPLVPTALGIGPYLRVQKVALDGGIHTLATVWGSTTRLLLGAAILLGALVVLWRLRTHDSRRGSAA